MGRVNNPATHIAAQASASCAQSLRLCAAAVVPLPLPCLSTPLSLALPNGIRCHVPARLPACLGACLPGCLGARLHCPAARLRPADPRPACSPAACAACLQVAINSSQPGSQAGDEDGSGYAVGDDDLDIDSYIQVSSAGVGRTPASVKTVHGVLCILVAAA